MPSIVDLKELGNSLHERLLRNADKRVTAEISEVFLPLLIADLRNKLPGLSDPHLAETAAIDTLMAYFDHPDKFDPAKGSLIGYLYMDAYWNLRNTLKQEESFVALHVVSPEHVLETLVGEADPERELLENSSPLVRQVLDHVTGATDREIVMMMFDGVRECAAYAEALGILDLPADEQAVIVKRHKDRLKKSLRRSLGKIRGRWR